jgi:dethiobiotin synthetase
MKINSSFVITGIGTEVGKTFCSTVICIALETNYWKPIQAGDLEQLDSDFVQKYSSNTEIEQSLYLLKQPLSPHESARLDGFSLKLNDFLLPTFKKNTLIEGAGGLCVPINQELLLLDVFKMWNLPLIVVTKHYLGSINHTLLTLQELHRSGLKIFTLVINGIRNESSERVYRTHFPELKITYISHLDEINRVSIRELAKDWKNQFFEL